MILAVHFILLAVVCACMRSVESAVEVVGPQWVKNLGLKGYCSFSTQFWGSTLRKSFENVTAVVSPGGQVICGTHESLTGYFLIEPDFNYLTNKENTLGLPCFNQEYGTLMNLLEVKPTLLSHNFSKYLSYMPRGISWTDNMYQSRSAFRQDLHEWITTAVIDCEWDPALLDIIQNTSYYGSTDPVILNVVIDSPTMQSILSSPVYRFFFQFLIGTIYMRLALLAMNRVCSGCLKTWRRQRKKQKDLRSTMKQMFRGSQTKPMHIVLWLQFVYCFMEGCVHLIDGWWTVPGWSTRARVAAITKETGFFTGISFLVAVVWNDLLKKLGGRHVVSSTSFTKRNRVSLVVGGGMLISIDVLWTILVLTDVVELNTIRTILVGIYLLAVGVVSLLFTRQAILFWRSTVWCSSFDQTGVGMGQDPAIFKSLRHKAFLLIISSGSKMITIAIMSSLSSTFVYTPAGWVSTWALLCILRILDCFLQIEISTKIRQTKKSRVVVASRSSAIRSSQDAKTSLHATPNHGAISNG